MIFKNVLKETKNINAQDKNGFTALHYAALSNNIQIIKILLQQKDINTLLQNNRGETFEKVSKDRTKIKILLKNLENQNHLVSDEMTS